MGDRSGMVKNGTQWVREKMCQYRAGQGGTGMGFDKLGPVQEQPIMDGIWSSPIPVPYGTRRMGQEWYSPHPCPILYHFLTPDVTAHYKSCMRVTWNPKARTKLPSVPV
jgi:hypothetical protein